MADLSRVASEIAFPAAQQLAEVTAIPTGFRVRLPRTFAVRAVKRFLRWYRVEARIFEGPRPAGDGIAALGANEWALVVGDRPRVPLGGAALLQPDGHDGRSIRVLPRYVVEVPRGRLRSLLAALENVKPEENDGDGRPYPWVSPTLRPRETAALHDEDDVEVDDAVAPRVQDEASDAETSVLTTREIIERFHGLCAVGGVAPLPLIVKRGRFDRGGFVTGRIILTTDGLPVSVSIVTCPNGDLAEVLATLAHELGHALARERRHGIAFRLTLLELAERTYGASFFRGARERASGPSRTLDKWIGSGIRAALQGREPPAPRDADDGQLARAIRRIGKLRALAADQMGRPEAIAATGQANDLVVAYGLEAYDVAAGAVIPDQMLDRWLLLGSTARWRHRLADTVAGWFEVFALSLGAGRMHLFGRHADLVATEYLYGVCAERIDRACVEYLARWKRERQRPPGAANRERVSFCDSAVEAFREKLRRMRKRDAPVPRASDSSEALVRAEAFARDECDKRGLGWGQGARRTYIANDAGAQVGRSLSVVRGVEGGAARLLESRTS